MWQQFMLEFAIETHQNMIEVQEFTLVPELTHERARFSITVMNIALDFRIKDWVYAPSLHDPAKTLDFHAIRWPEIISVQEPDMLFNNCKVSNF
jgi:hypothetical protein